MQEESARIVFEYSGWHIAAGLMLAAAAVFFYLRTWPPLPRPKRALLSSLRIVSFLLLMVFIINPAIVKTRVYERKPVVALLVDDSRSMVTGDCSGRSRIEAAWDVATDLENTLNNTVIRLNLFDLSINEYDSARSVPPKADGDGTDIYGAVEGASRAYGADNLQAVVVLSDGRVTGGLTGNSGPAGVPVYTVGFGDTLEGSDLAVEDVYCERVLYMGTVQDVGALLGIEGSPGGSVMVRLKEDGVPVDSAYVSLAGRAGNARVGFKYVPGREGKHILEVEASPFDGERSVINNSMRVRVNVLKDRLKVLYIDQYADWNLSFIRQIARGSQRLEIEPVGWTPSGGYRMLRSGESWSFPSGASGFAGYDMLIIGEYDGLSSETRTAEVLERFVRGGGALLMLGSERSPLADGREARKLERFLPVAVERDPSIEKGEIYARWSGRPGDTPFGASLASAPDLDSLPPLSAVITGFKAKPGAEDIMKAETSGRQDEMLLVERYGQGFSGVILAFPVWRWKLEGPKGERFYTALISGLIEYMSEGMDRSGIDIYPGRTVYRTGEPVDITAFVKTSAAPSSVMGEIRSVGDEGNGILRKFAFNPERGSSDLFRARLEPLPPGDYAISASGEGPSGETVSGTGSVRVESASIEFIKTSRDARFLRKLASDTGGKYLDWEDAGALPGLMQLKSDSAVSLRRKSMRGDVLLFALLILTLASEWILRKVWGLV